jgi:tetratricopeptide (TPR) repeat protein
VPNLEDYNQLLSDQIVAIVEQGNRLHHDHKWDQALDKYAEAWELLPEPIAHWDLTEWIASCKVSIYMERQDYQQANEWALIAVEAVKDNPRQTSAKITVGMICYETNNKEEAYRWFEEVHNFGGARAFQGFDRKYLQFYTQMRQSEKGEQK